MDRAKRLLAIVGERGVEAVMKPRVRECILRAAPELF
jgi:hypothetical protein